MQNFVLGTAGHIDHGKSTLIKALTGIETDTTKEEQSRGLTINLGFSHLDLPNGEEIGIVDVPGHEKFVKNMLAGASGIDAALLVIDANEGIMPQTKEHAAILELLGIKDYIIVLTKVKDADELLIEIVKDDIREQFKGTSLEGAEIVETDAIAGIGLDELITLIQAKSETFAVKNKDDLPARLNVDRAFSIKGIGTVVTGTLIEGTVKVGDNLTLYPAAIETTVRNIQIHDEDQPAAYAGNRTALNLTKITLDDVERGDVLSASELDPTYMLDAKVNCIADADAPIQMWDRMHVNIGTKEVVGRVVPLGVDEIYPGESGYIQLRLEEQVTVKRDDRFILRRFSPVVTIGGGIVLDDHPSKHKRFDDAVLASLAIKESGDLTAIVADFLRGETVKQHSMKNIVIGVNESEPLVSEAVAEMLESGDLKKMGQQYMLTESFDKIAEEMQDVLHAYHEDYPMRTGMSVEEFRSRFNQLVPRDVDAVLKALEEDHILSIQGQYVALADFNVTFTEEQQQIRKRLEKEVKDAGMSPPFAEQVVEKGTEEYEIFGRMLGEEFYQLNPSIVLHREVFEEAKEKTLDYLEENGEISLGEARDMLDTSRKYAVPFLEHLDELGLTQRRDDVRILRRRK